jgi:MoaA/NifB/PqqE/SkfB family radical SAM enzyme
MTRRSLPMAPSPRLDERGEQDHSTKGLVRLTMACNERCPFCNVPVEDYPDPTPSDAQVQAELDAFIATGERTLTISGGEPTLRKTELLAVIRQARERGVPFVELQTNAILIDAAYAEALAEAGLTSGFVSLLSDDAALHDELAGLSGAFPLCLRGIDALVDAGVAVTLNPVFARATQGRVAAYVDFVAERLPRVAAISLSAVQPHGRARRHRDLMPDYDALGLQVLAAQERAQLHGIRLLNPYCGLPLCVGWSAARARSVEAIEAAQAWRDRALRRVATGIDNRGNKRHGAPCRGCALRTRCGGAWHAVWDERGGRGIAAPMLVRAPWWPDASGHEGQAVVRATDRVADALESLGDEAPTQWLWCRQLGAGDGRRLADSAYTNLALMLDSAGDLSDEVTRELAVIDADNLRRDDQTRLVVALGLRTLGSFERGYRAVDQAARAGAHEVHLLMAMTSRHRRFVQAVRRAHPMLAVIVDGGAPVPGP